MAQKRMFSKDIVGSDAFIEMPTSSQLLYFHLGMEADDDGFLGSPKRVQRIVGSNDDDLKILIAKRFVIIFPSGVLAIKHHRINNNWDKYNCKRTLYIEEFSQLYLKENRAYSLDKTKGTALQSVPSLQTVFRIEENRIDTSDKSQEVKEIPNEDEVVKPPKVKKDTTYEQLFALFPEPQRAWHRNRTQINAAKALLAEQGIEKCHNAIRFATQHQDEPFCPVIHSPYDLDTKWQKLQSFRDRK